jgi:hypothetical protein
MTFTNPLRRWNSFRASSLSGRLAVVARDAQRLKVRPIKPSATRLNWLDMVHHRGRHKAPTGPTGRTQRGSAQYRRSYPAPLVGLIKTHFRIKASACPSIVTVHCDTMLRTKAGDVENGPAARVSARGRGTLGHPRHYSKKKRNQPTVRENSLVFSGC